VLVFGVAREQLHFFFLITMPLGATGSGLIDTVPLSSTVYSVRPNLALMSRFNVGYSLSKFNPLPPANFSQFNLCREVI